MLRKKIALFLLILALAGAASGGGALFGEPQGAADKLWSKLGSLFPELDGRVIGFDAARGELLIALPKGTQASRGMEFMISRPGQAIIHPVTKERLGTFDELIAVVAIIDVKGDAAKAALLQKASGKEIRGGDSLKPPATIEAFIAPAKNLSDFPLDPGKLTYFLSFSLQKKGRFSAREAPAEADLEELAKLAGGKMEYAVFLQPALVGSGGDLKLEVRVSSIYSGKTIELLSEKISASELNILARETAPAAQVAAKPATETQETKAKGPRLLNPEIVYQGRSPSEVGQRGAQAADGRVIRQSLAPGIRAIDFGDLDGDGKPEMVAIKQNSILIYRWSGNQFEQALEIRGKAQDNYLAVDVADINGNGLDEIFVTNLTSYQTSTIINEMKSFAFEYSGGKYVKIWRDAPYFLRVIKNPANKKGALLGQKIGVYELFSGNISELKWQGGTYARNPDFLMPEGFQLYGFNFGDLRLSGQQEIALIGDDGYLRIFTPNGDMLFETEEELGVSDYVSFQQVPANISGRILDERQQRPFQVAEYRYIKGRVLIEDIDGDGVPDVIAPHNAKRPGIGDLLAELKFYSGGNLVNFAWTGNSFAKLWETRKRKGDYVADVGLVDLNGDGIKEIAILSVERKIMGKESSSLTILTLGG